MSLYAQDNQRVRVKKIVSSDQKGTVIHCTTSRKRSAWELENRSENTHDFLNGDYAYSEWGFVRVTGNAHKLFQNGDIKEGDVITVKMFITKEPYEDKNGEVVNPKTPQFTIFQAEVYQSSGNEAGASKKASKKAVELPSEDDIPF